MRLAASLSLALLAGATPQDDWFPARPLAQEALARAPLVAAEGAWLAGVRELPLPEPLRRHHAPRAPWQLMRMHGEGEPELLLDVGGTNSGWGAPSLLAIGADGSLAATWRPGHEVFFAPPGGSLAKLRVHDDARLESVALTPTALVLVDRESRSLQVRALSAEGVGEPVALGAFDPHAPGAQAFGAPWLAWIDAAGELRAIDVERGVRRSVRLAEARSLRLDGIWNGRLLAHRDHAEEGAMNVLLVELERERVHALRAPAPVRACLPEGVFTDGWLWDPVAGRLAACETTPRGRERDLFRRAPGRVWIRGSEAWRELRLDEAPAPLPPGSTLRPGAAPPVELDDEPAREARAAWRAMRGA